MRVPGLLTGLAVTLRHMLRRSTTRQYPEVEPELPPRTRGVIALHADNCTSCMLCARECPDWCIYIDSHKEKGPDGKARNELDRFAIDYSLCMYCGICIDVCPFDALFWAPDFAYATYDVVELTHERDVLGSWLTTAPDAPANRPAVAEPEPPVVASVERVAGS